ncbi:hypothetical protein [Streptomyces sp. NPDC089795]|uniref:hypothetical protein n=1 Tax=Streptomyces sp. NPDC089795 TaxID=3155297 RepID=UPI00341DF2ED
MIGEPELDGEWGPAAPAELVESEPARLQGAVRARPWRSAVVAVVATSALWAGGLHAFGDLSAEPEIRYRFAEDLCDQFKAPALEGLLGPLGDAVPKAGGRHPALDRASCARGGERPSSTESVQVTAVVELHKKTDPAPEFAVDSPDVGWFAGDSGEQESMPGLGEEAIVSRARPRGGGHRLPPRDR